MLRRTAIAAAVILGLVTPQMAHAQLLGRVLRDAQEQGQSRPQPPAQPQPQSRGSSEQQQAARAVQSGQFVQMAQISSALNRRTPGEMQDATLINGDRPVYQVRWRTSDGKRINYVVDARTGAVLSGG